MKNQIRNEEIEVERPLILDRYNQEDEFLLNQTCSNLIDGFILKVESKEDLKDLLKAQNAMKIFSDAYLGKND